MGGSPSVGGEEKEEGGGEGKGGSMVVCSLLVIQALNLKAMILVDLANQTQATLRHRRQHPHLYPHLQPNPHLHLRHSTYTHGDNNSSNNNNDNNDDDNRDDDDEEYKDMDIYNTPQLFEILPRDTDGWVVIPSTEPFQAALALLNAARLWLVHALKLDEQVG